MHKKITIIGSGLAGSLLAIYLSKRDYEVEVFDARPDPRTIPLDKGRSINLALSCRGLTGLSAAGLFSQVQKCMVPMRSRIIHKEEGGIALQAFGRDSQEHINAIQRSDLNQLLLNQLDKYPKAKLQFNMKLLSLDIQQKILFFECKDGSKPSLPYHRLIGCDGASSVVRACLEQQGLVKFSRIFLAHGYKELSIYPPSIESDIERENLHLWPRDSFLLLGNPNIDHSVTGSLFLANEGKKSFKELDNELKVAAFFKEAFPDAYPMMPHLLEEFLGHPTGNMSTIQCTPWHYEDNCLLIGDAAHGVVPFFGQGMNAAFEDCRILDELLQKNRDDWKKVMPLFYKLRKPNTDAVAQMSLDNYQEIQTNIRLESFNFKKELEQVLMHKYPYRYVSKHVLVMFSNTPYAQAYKVGDIQRKLLDSIAKRYHCIEEIQWNDVDKLMKQYDKKLAKLDLP